MKPWWQSKTIYGIIFMVISFILSKAGVSVGEDSKAEIMSIIETLAGVVGACLALYGRVKAEKAITVLLLALTFLIAMPRSAFAGPSLLDEPSTKLALPEVPEIENPDWLRRGSVWSFVWADVSDGETGAGLRLGYELTSNIRLRFDYLVESFAFDEGVFADESEVTLSMRYELIPDNSIAP